MKNIFTNHPKQAGENYIEHFLFSFGISLWLLFCAVIALCHAIFPFTFTFTTGNNLKKINIPKLIQDTDLKNKESVYGVPHDRGAQAILRKNKINILIGFLKLIWYIILQKRAEFLKVRREKIADEGQK